jgi:hypothetical protein
MQGGERERCKGESESDAKGRARAMQRGEREGRLLITVGVQNVREAGTMAQAEHLLR